MHTLHKDSMCNRFPGQWKMVFLWKRTLRILTWGATVHLPDFYHLGNSFIYQTFTEEVFFFFFSFNVLLVRESTFVEDVRKREGLC